MEQTKNNLEKEIIEAALPEIAKAAHECFMEVFFGITIGESLKQC